MERSFARLLPASCVFAAIRARAPSRCRYVAFVWTRALSSAANKPEEWARKRGVLLANLLAEVNAVLSVDLGVGSAAPAAAAPPEAAEAAESPLAALGAGVRACMGRAAAALGGATGVAVYELSTCLEDEAEARRRKQWE